MDSEYLNLALLVLAGCVAGFLNVLAGGGSLITLPLLIFIGLPPTSANGTNRLGILAQAITATWRFHRAGAVDWKAMWKLAVPSCIGALAGAIVAARMAETDFKSLVGWITLVAGAIVAIDLNSLLRRREGRAPKKTIAAVLLFLSMLAVGFYGGLAQAGVGYLILAALVLADGMDIVRANVHKSALVIFFTPIALVVFGWNAQIHLPYAIALTIGQVIGGYVGADLTLKHGARYIRPILAIVVFGTAIELLWG